MVLFSEEAIDDLHDILFGLITWRKHPLNPEHAMDYVDDISDVCLLLDTVSIHISASRVSHKRYGEKVYRYRRNPNTIWYIIYDVDKYGNVFVNKIMSNYTTE